VDCDAVQSELGNGTNFGGPDGLMAFVCLHLCHRSRDRKSRLSAAGP